MTFFNFLQQYWFILVIAVAVIAIVAIKIYTWFKKPNNEQIKQIQEWLLFAVAKAEEVLGSGTGQLKLRYVYDMFITKFPAAALFISFDDFSAMVDKALQQFEDLIKENPDIKLLVRAEDCKGIEEGDNNG